jgi:HAD superfamily hydrolase (TIGR01509 family)
VHDIIAILFDWDGTLLDSFPSGFRASMAVFEHFGIPTNERHFMATYSPNWYQTYRRVGLPEESWTTADRIWLEAYHREPPELYPFARKTLETLKERGYDMGLVTSGNRKRVSEELERYGLKEFFSARVYFEDTQEKKPHPAPLLTALEQMRISAAKSAYVGDRPEDIFMGRRTGAFTVAVVSSYVSRQELEAARPDLIVPDAGHIPARFGPKNG